MSNTKRILTDYSKEQKDHLSERARFAENDAKVLEEMAAELRELNFAIEACGHDGKIEYEKACSLAASVVKIAANYLSRRGGGEL